MAPSVAKFVGVHAEMETDAVALRDDGQEAQRNSFAKKKKLTP